ncbi:uncharacterized protein LOC129217443 isoform X2 [Uloborus diversus]|uniref:uncharacterized protein LOC129217443 isoform X2 n=1 Tax=Uloborus diversus TaxID=327109 RepID=UPI0024099533|nr:uncharacterized protein LOC129217443 isoform X2 [Uloborus diversus]
MPCVRFGFFLVFLAVPCLGKTIVRREIASEPEKDPSALETGRRKFSTFGQPGLPRNFPIASIENDLERTPAPEDDIKEPSNDDDERDDVTEGRRIPDEGFFARRQFQKEDEREGDFIESDVETDAISEIDNEIGKGEDEERGKIPGEISLEISEESGINDTTGDDPSKGEDDHEDEGGDRDPEDEEKDEGPDTVPGTDSAKDNADLILNQPFFVFRRLFKYFTMFEKVFERFFHQTMDELPQLNGTYANTTEEDVDIDGHLFHAITTLIKDRAKNETLYIETLSSLPNSNVSEVLKEEN